MMNLQNPRHLELALIAAALNDPDTLRIAEIRALRPHHFRHMGWLWDFILKLPAAGREPSLTELAQEVGKPGWQQGFTVTDLIDVQAYSLLPQELPGAAAGILNAYRREHAATAAADLSRSLSSPDTDHLAALATAQATLTDLLTTTPRESTESIADDLDAAMARILNPQQHRGVTTGLPSWDAVLGGWQPGTLNILAARPSMGKSLLLGQCGQIAAMNGHRALMFSLEDGPEITRMRALCRMAGVELNHAHEPGSFAPARLSNAKAKLEDLRERWLIDSEATLDGIVSACWRAHQQTPLKLVLIDQLSHVLAEAPRQKADNRNQLYGYVTKTLKREVAQRLGVPVVLASQLTREAARRGDGRPELTDLRDSGELEQDADTVTFIHRPEQYDPTDKPGIAELLIKKNRNGPTKTIEVQASMKTFKFWEGYE